MTCYIHKLPLNCNEPETSISINRESCNLLLKYQMSNVSKYIKINHLIILNTVPSLSSLRYEIVMTDELVGFGKLLNVNTLLV